MDKDRYEKEVKVLKDNITSREALIAKYCSDIRKLRDQNDEDRELIENIENAYLFGEAPAAERIMKYIEQCNYTWTLEKLKIEYQKFTKGEYVSFTCNEIITNFSAECKELFG